MVQSVIDRLMEKRESAAQLEDPLERFYISALKSLRRDYE